MCEFDKLDKTFASDLYLIYKRSPSARVCISDTNRNIKSWCSGTADIQCESLTFRAYRRFCINAPCHDNYLAVNFFSSREVNDWAWKTFNVSSEFGETIFFIHFTFLTDAFARNVKPRIRIPAVHLQSFHILIYISTLPKQNNETFIVNYLVWKLLLNIRWKYYHDACTVHFLWFLEYPNDTAEKIFYPVWVCMRHASYEIRTTKYKMPFHVKCEWNSISLFFPMEGTMSSVISVRR